jgi:uncharacterized membrane protein
MIRARLIEKGVGADKNFRWRNHEITRIEGLSDAVFAFAVTLLVISLEVPKTFNELVGAMHGIIAFALSFAVLFQVWHLQYVFFRRYGLQDTLTIVLNGVLLFVVLCYVYPLKFLFLLLGKVFTGRSIEIHLPGGIVEPMIAGEQVPTLMIIYGIGFTAVFLVFALLYYHAYRKRAALELNETEAFETLSSVRHNALSVAVGVLSIGIALFGGAAHAAMSGYAYFLLGPVLTANGMIGRRKRKQLCE